MANNIERLNYYEREYLRSFDFTAEQNYHLEMRRRLNLALHLWGIVEGLDVLKSDPIPGVPDQFYISAGMAIDAYGREIVLFSNYALSSDDLDANQITGTTGSYSLFIAYSKELTTPPSSGFGVCDIADQYTRQRESFKVVISRDPDPTNEPTATSELSDNPKDKPWLVRLGTIIVGPDPITNRLSIANATAAPSRVYIGLRAQRVVTPADATKSFEILRPNTALAPPTSLGVQANLFAEQNAIIGSDFEVKPGDIFPPVPAPPPVFPNPTGNLKVASDLFLRGNLYANIGSQWLSLGEQIKALTPEILVGLLPITITSPNSTDPGNDTERFNVPTKRLKKVGSAYMTASIAAVIFNKRQVVNQIFGKLGNTAKISYEIIRVAASPGQTSPNSCDIEIEWRVKPTAQFNLVGPPASTEFRSPIIGLTFAYMIVCIP